MYKSIVVGTDGSGTAAKAVQRAAELAAATGSTLHVVGGVRLPSRTMAVAPEGAYAEREGAGLIVVGSRGMTGLGRVKGSVPNSVAHKAICDVLIVYTTGE